MAAREHLMEQAFSHEDNVFGSTEEILQKAKRAYTEELQKELDKTREAKLSQERRVNKFIDAISSMVNRIILFSLIALWIFVLASALIYSSPTSLIQSRSLADVIRAIENSYLFIFLGVVTILNLIFGFRMYSLCNLIAIALSTSLKVVLREWLVGREA